MASGSDMYATGSSRNTDYSHISRRRLDIDSGQNDLNESELEDIISKTSSLKLNQKETNSRDLSSIFINLINPLILTALSAFVRLYRIEAANTVVWDEAHFGKFGSYYLKREFYFDVHPPLGKLLVGLSGFLADYNGGFDFESSEPFPDNCNYVLMRCFNCGFGILCTPIAYKTAVALGYSQLTVWFISLLVIFEMISLTLSKFILLDSMLLFFTVLCFYCLVNIHNLRIRNELLTTTGLRWLLTTGISIGCVCSVKWVGLFVTVLIGLYVIYDLLIRTYQLTSSKFPISLKSYLTHWVSRIVTLIFVPFVIYLACFKVHFAVLKKSGTGDGSISTLFQGSLEGNTLQNGPRSVAYGSLITLRSQGLSPNLLHSHPHVYPEGSHQQQITTYGYKDDNNEFLVEFDLEAGLRGEFATFEPENNESYPLDKLVHDGDVIRLVHKNSGCLLHSHPIMSSILSSHYEVSCYANLDDSDLKDEWVVELQSQEVSPSKDFQNEDPTELHPISTNFRLRHKVLGCYLATTGFSYPPWGFQQGEVVCKTSLFQSEKSTWWNIEDHLNDKLPSPEKNYVPPPPKFWKEFILLNYGMMASNNALVPDPDKFDRLSSEWWEWPILHSGLRMCGWTSNEVKYFLIGHPFITWFSTLNLILFVVYIFVQLWRWQRQKLYFPKGVFDIEWNNLIAQGVTPFVGWVLHYVPFILMGRVTYLHHYVPALYFAIFISGFMMESIIHRHANRYISYFLYGISYLLILGVFWYLKDLALGMEGSSSKFRHLKLLSSWMV